MLKEEMDAAAQRHPEVRYEPQLIDATYALLLTNGGDGMVIPSLNRDGDCLSDFVIQMFGSIAGAESLLISFDEEWRPCVVMAEAPHGTAPSLQGKNIANPMAMFLASAALLRYGQMAGALQVSRSIYEAVFEAIYEGHRTPDLGGSTSTTEFTDEIIRRVKGKLEVWETLGS
jgi:isocitrate/isopropylmalate dehydrogenase